METEVIRKVSDEIARLESYRLELTRDLLIKKFKPRKDDIYIVTYMKSGTTLTQMILYQMFTNGSMEFNHIYEVSPWFEQSIDLENIDRINNIPSPRLIKSHLIYSKFPEKLKGKIIYVTRNGMDVALSLYHHVKNCEVPNLKWEDLLDRFLNSNEDSWYLHIRDWKRNVRDLDILYLRYEDLTLNMEESIQKIADFLDFELTDEIRARVLERCHFKYMKKYQHKFGERPESEKLVYDQFIRKGESFKGELSFSPEQRNRHEVLQEKFLHEYLCEL